MRSYADDINVFVPMKAAEMSFELILINGYTVWGVVSQNKDYYLVFL